MALTEGDKAICAEVAREIVERVVRDCIEAHISACPHGQLLFKGKWLLVGLSLAAGFGGGGFVAVLIKAITSQ